METKKNTFTDFEEFYDRNEPGSAGELADLYRSVVEISDETFFKTTKVRKGKSRYQVTAVSGDVLLLTEKSYQAFKDFIESKNTDPDLDIEEAADFEYSINNPNS